MNDISILYDTNEQGEQVLKPRPSFKYSEQDICNMIAKHWPDKQSNIESIAFELLNDTKLKVAFDYKDAFEAWELERDAILQANSDNSNNEDYVSVTVTDEPVLSWQHERYGDLSALEDGEDLLECEQFKTAIKQQTKLYAFEHNGVMCGITEADQNGWTAVKAMIEYAEKKELPIAPFFFSNENGNKCPIEDVNDWDEFYMKALQSRAPKFQQ